MQDTCVVLTYASVAKDLHGRPQASWTANTPTKCGFDPKPGGAEAMGTAQLPLYDASLRLPLSTVVDHLDRVRVSHRFGVAEVAPITYEIVGQPRQGPSGLVLRLKRITGV